MARGVDGNVLRLTSLLSQDTQLPLLTPLAIDTPGYLTPLWWK